LQPVHNGNKQVMIALERPGASADLGRIQDRDILQGVTFRFPAPDISGRVRYGGERTYLQASGIFRYIKWDDNAPTATTNLGGHAYGWGAHLSSNIGVGAKDTFKWSAVYGHGVENYMNDAPVDVAPTDGAAGVRRIVVGYQATVAGVGVPIDGEVVVSVLSGTGFVFDAYAPQGDLAPYLHDVLSMSGSASVAA
jgi:hypothetical protein